LNLNGYLGKINSSTEKNAAESIYELVDELLDIDLYTNDDKQYNFHATDISKIVSDIIESVSSLSFKRNIKINWVPPVEKMQAEIDSKKIAIVLQNLIDNAIKYGNPNSAIDINLKKINSLIRITVQNEGIGIPKEDSDDIFQRFFRAKNAVRKETEGMGIGLFISKNIIEDHCGRIWFDSTKDGTTTFNVEIPISRKL
jgi:signal transduction histidine kinase